MKWNLRLAAANRNIWQASQMQRLLAERGLIISAGKMSNLWSGKPVMIRLDDLDVICAVLACEPGELLVPEPETVAKARPSAEESADARVAGAGPAARLRPRATRGRTLPPA